MTVERNVLIYGAGEAGEMVLGEIQKRPEESITVSGFIDDDKKKLGTCTGVIPVLGGKCILKREIRKLHITEVIIAMPSIKKQVIKEIVRICKSEKVKLLIVPSTREIIEGSVRFNQIKVLDPSDLLDRDEVKLEKGRIRGYIEGNNILVTGAAGSIGSELVYKLLGYTPRRIIALDINENGLFYLLREIEEKGLGTGCRVIPCVSDIKSVDLLKDAFERWEPEVVFHAAAYKHVPLMENNVRMIYLNNVMGTYNLLELSRYFRLNRFIGISTDKAVYPVSVMGKTKRIGELLMRAYSKRGLRASGVRFGNVLGSNGSVITVFKKQIKCGGPVTITSPEMVRYFMTVDEATSLVLQAGSMGQAGDMYVLDMGDPIKIKDLAENMIILSGLTPGADIELKYTGIRAGEKLSEDLFYDETQRIQSGFKGITIERGEIEEHFVISAVESTFRNIYFMQDDEILRTMDEIIGSYSIPGTRVPVDL